MKTTGLADILRDAIRDSGLSAHKLGDATGIKQQTISMFLLGKADIRISTVERLLDYFGGKVTFSK